MINENWKFVSILTSSDIICSNEVEINYYWKQLLCKNNHLNSIYYFYKKINEFFYLFLKTRLRMDAYIYLIHYCINVAVSALSLKFSSDILFKKMLIKNSSNLVPFIFLYVIYCFILNITMFFHYFYMLVLWRPNQNVYDARILFAIGGLSTLISILHPFVEIFLCIERCIIVVFPLKYNPKLKFIFSSLSAMMIIAINGLVFVNSSLVCNFPSNSTTICQMYYCIGFIFPSQYAQLIKAVFAFLNVLLCVLLYLLLKKFTNDTSSTAKRINKTIMYMTIATVLVDFAPNVIGQLFFAVSCFFHLSIFNETKSFILLFWYSTKML